MSSALRAVISTEKPVRKCELKIEKLGERYSAGSEDLRDCIGVLGPTWGPGAH